MSDIRITATSSLMAAIKDSTFCFEIGTRFAQYLGIPLECARVYLEGYAPGCEFEYRPGISIHVSTFGRRLLSSGQFDIGMRMIRWAKSVTVLHLGTGVQVELYVHSSEILCGRVADGTPEFAYAEFLPFGCPGRTKTETNQGEEG